MDNPQLTEKLKAAVVGKLASDDADASSQMGDVPSDPPSVAAAPEEPDVPADVQSEAEDAPSAPPANSDEPSRTADRGLEVEDEGVLLEPGVASVEELFRSDAFSKGVDSEKEDTPDAGKQGGKASAS